MMDWALTAKAARRAEAAYIEDDTKSRAAFEGLGDMWIGQLEADSHQATVTRDASGGYWLNISGTRASDFRIMDVFADVSLDPVQVTGGKVTQGVYAGMDKVWSWAKGLAPVGTVWNVTGHSLGASRTHLTPLFLPASQIGALFSYEAPKFLDAQFYATHAGELASMVCVLNGSDLWCGWPWFDQRWQDRPQRDHIWLKDSRGTFAIIDPKAWPGGRRNSDHDIGLVCQRLEKIAAASTLTPAA
ncbi:hypothetical protein [Burkholderia pseudomallei]|uniref:hypothetical protein n=1 Tax=Burkholderia pseudomallei TaxID=28450 RepID=UPI0011AB63C2|nr:hypothetical protein [Burkholderia pseudomallei]